MINYDIIIIRQTRFKIVIEPLIGIVGNVVKICSNILQRLDSRVVRIII